MLFKKLHWTLKRHPFLYLTRFRLLSKNCSIVDIENYTYNIHNPKTEIPKVFYEINSIIFENFESNGGELDKIKQLCIWLRKHIKGGPGLSLPSEKALRYMLEQKGGVCSDLVQLFNNFCVINEIQVREWGVTRAPFDSVFGGHSFNEVYISELNKWVLLDVSKCLLFFVENNDKPLSVIELFQALRQKAKLNFKSFYITKDYSIESVQNNYLNSGTTPFLVCNYKNKTYDTLLNITRPFCPVIIPHFLLYIFGKSYYYCFPLDDYKTIFKK